MKNLKIVKNYIVRDPSTIIVEGSDYKTKSFTSEINGQVLFESIIPVFITNILKTEIYINGVRYEPQTDYKIINGYTIKWVNPYTIHTTDSLVFVWR